MFISGSFVKKYLLKQGVIFSIIAFTLTACDQNSFIQNPQNNATTASPTPTPAPKPVENPKIPIKVDLPIYLDGVPSLLHPVVVSSVEKYAEKSYEGSRLTSNIAIHHYNLTGEMFNLVFENIETGITKPLFKENTQLIHQVEYLTRPLDPKQRVCQPNKTDYCATTPDLTAKELKLYKHFIYQVQEKVVENKDENSIEHQKSLYLSDEYGNQLQKLHSDHQYLTETRWIPETERYYFTTKSDSNQDGKITLADQTYNYYIDFKDMTKPNINTYDIMPK